VRFLFLPFAFLVSGVLLASCMGGRQTAATGERVENPSTTAESSTSAQIGAAETVAPDFSHIAAASAALFDEVSSRLLAGLGAIVECVRAGDEGAACVSDERGAFTGAFQAAVQTWNNTGPETRSNPCYRRLETYGRVLTRLRTGSEAIAATESGQGPKLRCFESKATQLQRLHRDAAARFLAACHMTAYRRSESTAQGFASGQGRLTELLKGS
jgi:hypothetical protein